jgi:hypothetical protein
MYGLIITIAAFEDRQNATGTDVDTEKEKRVPSLTPARGLLIFLGGHEASSKPQLGTCRCVVKERRKVVQGRSLVPVIDNESR